MAALTFPLTPAPTATVTTSVPDGATVVGVLVAPTGGVPPALGLDRDQLAAAGFDGSAGAAVPVPSAGGPLLIAVGIGDEGDRDAAALRDAGAAFARAASTHAQPVLALEGAGVAVDEAARAVVEGAALARYRYSPPWREPKGTALTGITLVVDSSEEAGARAGAARGRAAAAVQLLARDLANTPHSHLNASGLAELATALGPGCGFTVEVFDKDALVALGCGGLLGVNAGSAEPPRMIKLSYSPSSSPTGHLTLVGKGVMYDSGGLSLKPGDEVHAQMKNDMSGAAAVLAAFTGLAEVNCPAAVTGYLMCTDNMPSGTAMALGDVLTVRGGITVEVVNTDAEGRLIMADALVLATEEPTDAIVDIATLTGACMRALGTGMAGVLGNDQSLVDQIERAAAATDERVWQLPLERRYAKELESQVADLKNLGGANGGAIHAALFLERFVAGQPWAHIDMAGTAQNAADTSWHTQGCSGFGARLLLELATDFTAPAR